MLTEVVIAVVVTVLRGTIAIVTAREDVVVAKDISMLASSDASAVVVMAEKGGADGGGCKRYTRTINNYNSSEIGSSIRISV